MLSAWQKMPSHRTPGAPAFRRELWVVFCAALLLTAYVWHAVALHYVVDDAFITFRYVRNFVAGNGLVFNPGERVEGYTNFLWALLLSAFAFLFQKIDLLLVAQVLGVLAGAATILLTIWFSKLLLGRTGVVSLTAAALLASNSALCAWSTGGLETTLYTFLIAAGTFAYLYYLENGVRPLLAPVLLALASMTRPDGVLFFGLLSLHLAWTEIRQGRGPVSWRTVRWVLGFAALFVPYYLWRLTYYGYPLPNTFYAKVGSGMQQYIRGMHYVAEYCGLFGAVLVTAAVLLLLGRRKERWFQVLLLETVFYTLYVVYVGGDGLAYYRFLVPILPAVCLLIQEGLLEAAERAKLSGSPAPQRAVSVTLCLVVLAAMGFASRKSLPLIVAGRSQTWYEPQSEMHFPYSAPHRSYLNFDNYFVDRQALAARWLEENAPKGAVLAATPAGSIAYYTNLRVIDMLGLNDVHIAHSKSTGMGKDRAGHEKGDGAYVLARSPDFILLGNVAVMSRPLSDEDMARKLVRSSERQIWANQDFHRQYERVTAKLADEGIFQYFTFYKKKAVELRAARSASRFQDERKAE